MKKNYKIIQKIKGLKEPLIVWGVMLIIFLPARLLFVHFAGNNWIGSLGLATGIAVTIVYLTRKQKLGWFGIMFVRQITKRLKKGKLKKLIYTESIFFMLVSSYVLIAVHYGDTVFTDKKYIDDQMINTAGQTLVDMKFQDMPEWEKNTILVLMIPYIMIFDYPFIANLMSEINTHLHGWLVTIYTVILFQQIESFGIIQLYRKALIHD